jgi:hypothetical protein
MLNMKPARVFVLYLSVIQVVLKYLLNKQFVGENQYVFRMDVQKHIIYDLLIWMHSAIYFPFTNG